MARPTPPRSRRTADLRHVVHIGLVAVHRAADGGCREAGRGGHPVVAGLSGTRQQEVAVHPIDAHRTGDAGRRALSMISDPELLEAVLRLAAAAGCELQRSPDLGQARRALAECPAGAAGRAAVGWCARAGLARRGRVLVLLTRSAPTRVWEQALAVGAERVVVAARAGGLAGHRADRGGRGEPSGAVRCSAVAGGRGGAGASVLAAAVAVTAVRDGQRALLVDCDPLGGGLDLVLGGRGPRGLALAGDRGRRRAGAGRGAARGPARTRRRWLAGRRAGRCCPATGRPAVPPRRP